MRMLCRGGGGHVDPEAPNLHTDSENGARGQLAGGPARPFAWHEERDAVNLHGRTHPNEGGGTMVVNEGFMGEAMLEDETLGEDAVRPCGELNVTLDASAVCGEAPKPTYRQREERRIIRPLAFRAR